MAHRGRLNVLVNTLGKMPKDLFSEFEGKQVEQLPMGDVKYHQGFSSDIMTPGGPMHLTLAFNPSHLEIVNPVVEGSVRARQHRRKDRDGTQVLPVVLHGDAAFIGQGVVMETLNLSQTRGYGTGGTLHVIVNNQIGFTTSDTRDTRSTLYCTDVAKMVEAPIFHVNGDDPEAVALVTEIALDFRMEFHKDVVIDLVCFRRLGHNEQDEPMVTQPLMYKLISQHPGTRKLYAEKLAAQGLISAAQPDEMIKTYRDALDAGFHTNKTILSNYKPPFQVNWAPFKNIPWTHKADTRRAHGCAQATRSEAHHRAAALQAALARGENRRRSPRHGCGHASPRLGHGGEPGLRIVVERRVCGAPVRTGQRPRHVFPSPCGAGMTRTANAGTPAPTSHCNTSATTSRISS